MSDLTAIDILVNPDDAAIEHAKQINARMRQSVPSGYALDATHQPHITTLQRYVRTADLDRVYDAVDDDDRRDRRVARSATGRSRSATPIGASPAKASPSSSCNPAREVLAFQAALLEAVTPYTETGGTAAAFVRDPGEQISQSTRDWVDGYVPAQIGEGHYIAHITVGFATLDDLKAIEAEPFDSFPVRPTSIAVYHLGNSGTARTELKAWALPE